MQALFGSHLGEFYALATAAVWAIAIVLFRLSGRQLGPFALNLFKNMLAIALLFPTIWILSGFGLPVIDGAALAVLLLSGFIGIGLADTLFFQALNRIGPSRTAIGGTLLTPCVMALSFLFLGERLSLLQFLGAALTLLGVVVVNYRRRHPVEGAAEPGALGLLMLAMALMAAGIVMVKPLLATTDFVWAVQLRLIGGVGGMLLMMVLRRRSAMVLAEYRAARGWGLTITASVIGSYLAMLLWLAGYKYADASVAAVLNESAAVFVLLLAALFLRERLSLRQWMGSAVAMAGVVLVVAG